MRRADKFFPHQTFYTRIAATEALKSFFLGSCRPGADPDARSPTWSEPKYLPIFSALYESLIDDDDEIREVAASAAAALTGRYMVAPEAANNLIAWLSQKFRNGAKGQEEFTRYVVCRLVGQQGLLLSLPTKGETSIPLTSAEKLLQKALDFDDSLFAAEEQNLFIDEVRETLRWREHGFPALFGGGSTRFSRCLVEWTRDGLEYILRLVSSRKEGDGPLGWASDQHVFAICARVILCARGMVRQNATAMGEQEKVVLEVGELLEQFRVVGEKMKVHGSLLEMASV